MRVERREGEGGEKRILTASKTGERERERERGTGEKGERGGFSYCVLVLESLLHCVQVTCWSHRLSQLEKPNRRPAKQI